MLLVPSSSITASHQDWLADLGAREHAAFVGRRHIAAETSTDVDAICATVARDVFFALPVRTRAGHELDAGTVLTDFADVRRYYESRSGSYVVQASNQLKSVASDWYLFNESSATLLGTGSVNGADAEGREFVVNSAVLFPSAPEGIRGEICATRHPFDDVVRGTVRASAASEIDNAALLDRWCFALRDGDWTAAAREIADVHSLAVRVGDEVCTARSGHESAALLPAIFGGATDLTLVVRVATEWYLFAEYLLPLTDGGSRRLAVIHPVEDGRITGSFGYGREDA
jgi:hypothetical protein